MGNIVAIYWLQVGYVLAISGLHVGHRQPCSSQHSVANRLLRKKFSVYVVFAYLEVGLSDAVRCVWKWD